MARAKGAHDDVIASVHRAQAHALSIRARAEMRLAEEYDEAQDRGEVAGNGGNRGNQYASVDNGNAATAADLGLRRDEIYEARQLRNAAQARGAKGLRLIDGALTWAEDMTATVLRQAA
jgi:hypothetical protein